MASLAPPTPRWPPSAQPIRCPRPHPPQDGHLWPCPPQDGRSQLGQTPTPQATPTRRGEGPARVATPPPLTTPPCIRFGKRRRRGEALGPFNWPRGIMRCKWYDNEGAGSGSRILGTVPAAANQGPRQGRRRGRSWIRAWSWGGRKTRPGSRSGAGPGPKPLPDRAWGQGRSKGAAWIHSGAGSGPEPGLEPARDRGGSQNPA